MITDPFILSSIALVSLLWAIAGGAIYAGLWADCPPGFQRLWFTVVCGPVAIALGLLAAWRAFRARMLQAYGVDGYSCCGGHACPSHFDHHEPNPNGTSGGHRRRGFGGDDVLNQPSVS